MKNISRILFTIFIASSMCACAPYKNLSTNRFEKKIKDNHIQLVDVRTPEEYAESHIPGSINIDVKDKENFPLLIDRLLTPEQKVAVYCRSGRRSRTASDILVKKGFKVYNLDKGILNWIEKGRKVYR